MAYKIGGGKLTEATLDLMVTEAQDDLTLADSHCYVLADSGARNVEITLPRGDGGSVSPGKLYIITAKIPNNNVTLTHHGDDRLKVGSVNQDYSSSPLSLTNGKTMWVIYYGINPSGDGEWHVIAEFDGTI